jgi:nucleoside-diphosphate-sugar epimerase/glycosyltransferase involved in cell wall biosynthesis
MNFSEKILSLKGPIIIFGSSGFVGSNLLNEILKYRKDCYGISHNPNSAWRLKKMKIQEENILHCDITYRNSVKNLFQKISPQTIFNLSAYGAYSKQSNTNLIYETNVLGTLNILEELSNISAYIHAGSSSEYGLNCTSPNEDSTLLPNSHYSISKISTSYLLYYFGKIKKLPCLNLRLYSIYGPWEEPDRLIPRLLEEGLKCQYPPLVNPNTTRDFVYIDDCINAFLLSANYMRDDIFGESINIGSGVKTSLKDLTNIVKEQFNIQNDPAWGTMNNRNWDTSEWYGNFSKANKLINWKPEIDLKSGFEKTTKWQVENNYLSEIIPVYNKPNILQKITPIIACYKDAEAIPVMYERLIKVFKEIGCNYEIIFVNDNSPDNTEKILSEICTHDLNVISIKHSRNFGSQAAFISGMEIASGDAIVLMDGDLQDPPELIKEFYKKWQDGYQVVYGRRIKREASLLMNFSYKTFYKLFRRMSDITIPQDAGDFSLIDKKVVEHLVALPEKEQFLRGLRAWVGFKQTGIDYIRPERMFGISTNNLRKNIWWAKKGIFSFSYLPLEIMSYFGVFLTGTSFLAILFQVFSKIMYPNIPQGVSTIIILILFFGGINIFAISIIGEYLSKVVDETKSRPKFIRDKVIIKGRLIETNKELSNLIK